MSASRPWLSETLRLSTVAGGAFVVGMPFGIPVLLALASTLGYFAWHISNLNRLQHWLKEGKRFEPPNARGMWGEVFNDIYRLQLRNRKRKRKLARYLKRFQEATAVWPDAVVILDGSDSIEWANTKARDLLGVRLPQDAGRPVGHLLRDPKISRFLTSGDSVEILQVPSPVRLGMTLALHVLPYGKKQQRLLVARDVTRLVRLEQVRRDFVANVSHELRTPLTVFNGYLETLSDAVDECPQGWAESLQAMQQQAKRMQHLVQDLLLLAHIEAEGREPLQRRVAVRDILESVRDEAQHLSGERAHRITLEADDTDLMGNARELRSAFSNLVVNAVQYTPAGGDIQIRWKRDAEGAHLEVQDTGVGIEAMHLPRLTERFYRVDVGRSRDRGGTGLGLAIVKHVLQRHDATLHVESTLGQGSLFRCSFPGERVALPLATDAAVSQ